MFRVGLGHDTHRLKTGKELRIGGVGIPHSQGPVAHSDGDVLLHAVTDALLGALAMGDIGEWFPDTDPEHENADSARLLTEVLYKVHGRGWNVVNLDAIIFAQRPKLAPFKTAIRQRVAELIGIPADCVSIKAKTGEHVGPVGREEAICAEVVVLLEHKEDVHHA
ncbi:MAG: 2-C-methyl-D-erythritol 2,4-cyclodiphosphate synthase [Planctomycetaceae bacterium]|nr:2-C-methyl-D-erythritol 2,4-cyclodiphosphate synthase [Planctomycetaceae bacterium]